MGKRVSIVLLVVVLLLVTSCLPRTDKGILGTWSAKLGENGSLFDYFHYGVLEIETDEYDAFSEDYFEKFFSDTEYVFEFKKDNIMIVSFVMPEDRKEDFIQAGTDTLLKDFENYAESEGITLDDAKQAFVEDRGVPIETFILSRLEGIWEEILDFYSDAKESVTYRFEGNEITVTDYEGGETILLLENNVIKFKAEQEAEFDDFLLTLEFTRR